MHLTIYPVRGQPLSLSVLEAGAEGLAGACLRSTGDPHTAHTVTEAIDPETGHVILLNLHRIALEVGSFKQADLVLLRILGKERLREAWGVRMRQREVTLGPSVKRER